MNIARNILLLIFFWIYSSSDNALASC